MDEAAARLVLAAIGQQTLHALARSAPEAIAPPGDHDLVALGPCKRPTEDQRAALAAKITTWNPEVHEWIRYGCVEPSGTIVEVAYEHAVAGRDHPEGVWSVLRVGGAGASVVATYSGTPADSWSKWDTQVSLGVLALVDLDADGNDDAIIATRRRENQDRSVTLQTWLSLTGKLAVQPGIFTNDIAFARGQLWTAGKPLVLQVDDRDAFEPVPRKYRCVEPNGTIDLCAAIVEARRVDRAVEIAGWFVSGDHAYGPQKTALPDRDLLARLLDELQLPAAARGPALAAVPPTSPALRAAADVERVITPKEPSRFGELLDPPYPADPRIAELEALLGDRPCPVASAVTRQKAVATIAAWMGVHDPSPWAHAPDVLSSCEDSTRGYYVVRWTQIVDKAVTARDAVFYVDAKGATSLATTSTSACADCGAPLPAYDARFVRHSATLVALVRATGEGAHPFLWATDGIATTAPASSFTQWYAVDLDGAVVMPDVIQIRNEAETHLWHWDGTWRQLPEFAIATESTEQPPRDPAAAWLWHESQRESAVEDLRAFDLDAWAASPAVRARTLRALALAGAGADVIAHVTTYGTEAPLPISPAPAASLADELRREGHGMPVLFATNAQGVAAYSADGTLLRQITTSKRGVELDDRREILFVVDETGDTLSAIDLREHAPNPVVIVRGLAGTPLVSNPGESAVEYQIRWSVHPGIEAGASCINQDAYPGTPCSDIQRAEQLATRRARLATFQLIGAAWIAKRADRALRPARRRMHFVHGRVSLWPSPFEEVAVRYCEHDCMITCYLRDRRRDSRELDGGIGGSCGLQFDEGARYWIEGMKICGPDMECRSIDDVVDIVGWLDPGMWTQPPPVDQRH